MERKIVEPQLHAKLRAFGMISRECNLRPDAMGIMIVSYADDAWGFRLSDVLYEILDRLPVRDG